MAKPPADVNPDFLHFGAVAISALFGNWLK